MKRGGWPRWGIALAVALTMASLTSRATATPSARLTYVRGEGAAACPDEDALRKAVAARLGYDPFFPAARKSVVAEVTRVDKGYRGRVVILNEQGVSRGERLFPPAGNDCSETVRAMALAISIALDDLSSEAPEPEPEPERVPEPKPPSRSPDLPVPARSAGQVVALQASGSQGGREGGRVPAPAPVDPSAPVEVRVGAGPHVAIGVAPSVAIGARVFGELAFGRRFSIGVEGRLDAPASSAIDGGGRVVSQYAGGGLVGCVRGEVPFACVTAGAGSFSGSGEAVAEPRTSSALLVLAGGRVGAELPLSRTFALRGFAGFEVPITRHEVQISGITRFRLPVVAGLVGADLVLSFR